MVRRRRLRRRPRTIRRIDDDRPSPAAFAFARQPRRRALAVGPARLPRNRIYRAAGEPKFTAIVMDARTGEILYDARADSPRYPASVTKVMNLYLVFEALAAGSCT